MRLLIALATAGILTLVPVLGAAAETVAASAVPGRPVVTLKTGARIPGAQIALGDIFDGAGDKAGETVAAAPAPGGSILFTATWLTAIAQSHGLSWQAPSPVVTIRVERAATEVTSADIALRLAGDLDADRPDRRVVLDSNLRLYAPVGGELQIAVEHLNLDRETSRFTAEIRIGGTEAPAVHITGRIQSLVNLAVLERAVMPGEVIRADDVSTSWIRTELAPAGGVTDPALLVGKTPRRPLRANAPLRPGDVELPIVIHRNDLVLIVLERPGMYMTAQGKALEDGGQGAVIRVANTQSSRTIDAVILGAGRVGVQAAGLAPATF